MATDTVDISHHTSQENSKVQVSMDEMKSSFEALTSMETELLDLLNKIIEKKVEKTLFRGEKTEQDVSLGYLHDFLIATQIQMPHMESLILKLQLGALEQDPAQRQELDSRIMDHLTTRNRLSESQRQLMHYYCQRLRDLEHAGKRVALKYKQISMNPEEILEDDDREENEEMSATRDDITSETQSSTRETHSGAQNVEHEDEDSENDGLSDDIKQQRRANKALNRTRTLMSQEVERLASVSSVLDEGSRVLRDTLDEHSAYSGDMGQSRDLLRRLKREDLLDRFVIGCGMTIFALAVLYVWFRRIRWFLSWFGFA